MKTKSNLFCSKEQLFTHEEVNECLWYYVKEKNLDPQSSGTINIINNIIIVHNQNYILTFTSEKQKSTTINLDTILADFLRKKNEPQIPKQEFLSLYVFFILEVHYYFIC